MRIAFSVALEAYSGQVLALATFPDMEKVTAAMAERSLLKSSVDFASAFEETTDLALMDQAGQAALFDASTAPSETLFDMKVPFAVLTNRPHGLQALADRKNPFVALIAGMSGQSGFLAPSVGQ